MKFWKLSVFLAVLVVAVLTSLGLSPVQADGYFYRFASPSTYTVSCDGGSPNHIFLNGTSEVEYNLPANGATIIEDIFLNGGIFEHLTFPKSGSGHFNNSGAAIMVSGFPASYAERFQTEINGQLVYTSMYEADCGGPGTGSGQLTNTVVVGEAAACLPIPDGSVVGDMPLGAQAFYAPGQATDITLNPGTYWVIGEDESGQYYEILLACQYLWVPVDTMQPSFQPPWSGQPLPTQVVS